MPEIEIPFPLKGLPLKPEMTGRVKVDDTLIQTIAAICGWDGEGRRLIRVSPNGIIRMGSALVVGVINVVADQDAYVVTCTGCPTSEALIRAFPDNTGRVFVNIGTAAALNTGYPLFTGEWVSLSVNDLGSLQLYIEKDTDKVAVIYTE